MLLGRSLSMFFIFSTWRTFRDFHPRWTSDAEKRIIFHLRGSFSPLRFAVYIPLPHLTVTGCQLIRRWAFKTMPDEFSFRRVSGSDFIKVLCGLRRESAKQEDESFNLRELPRRVLCELSADKLCSFLRSRNHGDLSRYPASYHYLRASVLRCFCPLRGYFHVVFRR